MYNPIRRHINSRMRTAILIINKLIFTSPREACEVLCWVCLFVGLSARITRKPHDRTSQNVLCPYLGTPLAAALRYLFTSGFVDVVMFSCQWARVKHDVTFKRSSPGRQSCLAPVWVLSGSCLGLVLFSSKSSLPLFLETCLGPAWVLSGSCLGRPVWVLSGSCLVLSSSCLSNYSVWSSSSDWRGTGSKPAVYDWLVISRSGFRSRPSTYSALSGHTWTIRRYEISFCRTPSRSSTNLPTFE